MHESGDRDLLGAETLLGWPLAEDGPVWTDVYSSMTKCEDFMFDRVSSTAYLSYRGSSCGGASRAVVSVG